MVRMDSYRKVALNKSSVFAHIKARSKVVITSETLKRKLITLICGVGVPRRPCVCVLIDAGFLELCFARRGWGLAPSVTFDPPPLAWQRPSSQVQSVNDGHSPEKVVDCV